MHKRPAVGFHVPVEGVRAKRAISESTHCIPRVAARFGYWQHAEAKQQCCHRSWWHTVPKQEEDESGDVAATTSTREYEPLLLSWPIVECANVIFHLRNEFTPPLTIAMLSHGTIQIECCERSVAEQMHTVQSTPRRLDSGAALPAAERSNAGARSGERGRAASMGPAQKAG